MGVSAGGMLACYSRKGLWLEVHAGGNPENGEGPQDLAGMACGCMRQQKWGWGTMGGVPTCSSGRQCLCLSGVVCWREPRVYWVFKIVFKNPQRNNEGKPT